MRIGTMVQRFMFAVALLSSAFVPREARAVGPLQSGETGTGSIAPGGGTSTWTFSANTGDAIVVRIGEISQTGALSPRIRVLSPSAVQIGTNYGALAAEVSAAATASGTFSIVVDDAAGITASGTYRLSLTISGHSVVVPGGDEGGALTNGLRHTGSLALGDLDAYTFNATAGDAIVLRMGESVTGSALTPELRLYSPAGALVDWGYGAAATEVAANAPVTGEYLVVASDYTSGFAGTGDYQLTLARTGAAVSVSGGDEGGPLGNGTLHTGSLELGDLDVWTFTANVGDAIVARMGETVPGSAFAPEVRVYSPAGVLVDWSYGAAAGEATANAPVSGEYLVIASDLTSGFAGSGGYRLNVVRSGAPISVSGGDEGGSLGNGIMHTGSVALGDLDAWTFTATAGDAFVARIGETVPGSTFAPEVRVYSPTGALVDWSYGAAAGEAAATAPVSGQYVVIASDLTSGFAGSGSYRLTVARTGTPVAVSAGDEGGPMTNGAMHLGNAELGDLDAWTVSANAGDAMVVRIGETTPGSVFAPQVRIYSPTGALLGSNYGAAASEVAVTAASTGDYLVVASDFTPGFAGSGDYRLTLARSGATFVTSAGDEGGPLMPGLSFGYLGQGDLDLWSLSAIVGQSLVAVMEETVIGSALTPQLRLYSPAGALLDWHYGASRAQVNATAPMTGSYLLVASDYSSGFAGSGNYRITPYYTTGTDDAPRTFELMLAPASPNPFMGRTSMRFSLATVSDAALEVFDAQGRLVRTLLNEKAKPAGEYVVEWDGRGASGAALRAGVYLARLAVPGRELVRKVMLTK